MRDYLLFLDTEASGLPKKWNLPHSNSSNWPSAVQISWVIYKNDGTLIKTENHYIGDQDILLNPSAIKIHGITTEFLSMHGEPRKSVMQFFAHDLLKYQPLVVGHFMEFDYHVAAADFFRAGISNPLEHLPSFCTMQASSFYSREPVVTHLRLGELYAMLFNAKLKNPHNALEDAKATARCFFELFRRGDITNEKIELQQIANKQPKNTNEFPWLVSLLILILITFFIYMWL